MSTLDTVVVNTNIYKYTLVMSAIVCTQVVSTSMYTQVMSTSVGTLLILHVYVLQS